MRDYGERTFARHSLIYIVARANGVGAFEERVCMRESARGTVSVMQREKRKEQR